MDVFLKKDNTPMCKRDLSEMKNVASGSRPRRLAKDRVTGMNTLEARTARADIGRRHKWMAKASSTQPPSLFVCERCSRDCQSRIGLYSHSKVSIRESLRMRPLSCETDSSHSKFICIYI